jgi:hypothetical protein
LGGIRKEPRLRQTSAVYLRPIRQGNGYTMLFFEAPHHLVLGEEARKAAAEPILKSRRLKGEPPEAPFRRR